VFYVLCFVVISLVCTFVTVIKDSYLLTYLLTWLEPSVLAKNWIYPYFASSLVSSTYTTRRCAVSGQCNGHHVRGAGYQPTGPVRQQTSGHDGWYGRQLHRQRHRVKLGQRVPRSRSAVAHRIHLLGDQGVSRFLACIGHWPGLPVTFVCSVRRPSHADITAFLSLPCNENQPYRWIVDCGKVGLQHGAGHAALPDIRGGGVKVHACR